eukprot:CAMPEP_0174830398 /NCGR_PEP_ID=MMETSP1114-20130205/2495_1 /TAXON_ID=312471 /ORGANISM="Neobodo designis, Strain CCAP 1951/1" /LENGTH=43 /DNA_ID= /DNA_START= /DNA_END= /DNA_ORIENTATION=
MHHHALPDVPPERLRLRHHALHDVLHVAHVARDDVGLLHVLQH